MVDPNNTALFNDLVTKIGDLMPLPLTIQKIIQMTRDPQTDVKELVVILEKDQAMVSKILKMANSSYYGFSRQITTIGHAVVCLGYNTIKNIALTASTQSLFKGGVMSYALGDGSLFKHSYGVAIASRIIARRVSYPNPEEVYVMGLLHDVGKMVVDQYAKQKFIEVIREFRKGGITFNEAEERMLGFNHGEIGAKVTEKWNLSPELVETIDFHHRPEEAKQENASVHMVHVADVVVEMLGIGLGYDGLNYELKQESMDRLKFTGTDIESLMMEIMDEYKTEDILEG